MDQGIVVTDGKHTSMVVGALRVGLRADSGRRWPANSLTASRDLCLIRHRENEEKSFFGKFFLRVSDFQ
jgi:hypothetical protein